MVGAAEAGTPNDTVETGAAEAGNPEGKIEAGAAEAGTPENVCTGAAEAGTPGNVGERLALVALSGRTELDSSPVGGDGIALGRPPGTPPPTNECLSALTCRWRYPKRSLSGSAAHLTKKRKPPRTQKITGDHGR